jgi:hypothetical protein
VPAGAPDGVDHLGAQFVGQLAQLPRLELADVGGIMNRVEQRRYRTRSHGSRLHALARPVDECAMMIA